jgi:glycosyltransferase involved in cell wall biosynthesis
MGANAGRPRVPVRRGGRGMSAPAADDAAIRLSWVLPLHRTAAQLDELVARIHRVSGELRVPHEIILVDDACPEGSGALAARKAACDPRLRVLRLARNHGQDRALMAGLRLSRGEWTVVLDADLQDPPEAMARLWPACTPAHDAVFARRTGHYSGAGRQATSRLYRALASRIGRLPCGAGLYVALHRGVLGRINAATRGHATLLALIAGARPRCASVDIVRAPRAAGSSSYGPVGRMRKASRSLWELLAMRISPLP